MPVNALDSDALHKVCLRPFGSLVVEFVPKSRYFAVEFVNLIVLLVDVGFEFFTPVLFLRCEPLPTAR